MNPPNARSIATRTIIPVTAAALCLGVAAPAMAQDGSGSTDTGVAAHQWAPPTLAQEQAWLTNWIDGSEAWLTAWGQKVADSDKYSDDVKADFAAQIAKAISGLDAVKAAVAAATTQDELADAAKTGFAAVDWPERPKPTATVVDAPKPPKPDPAKILAAKQARWADHIAKVEDLLKAKAAKVAASDKFTDEQKTAYASEVSKTLSELDALGSAIAAATTLDELKAAIENNHIDWPDRLVNRHAVDKHQHGIYTGKHRAPTPTPFPKQYKVPTNHNGPTSTTVARTNTKTVSYRPHTTTRTGEHAGGRSGGSHGGSGGFGR